MNFLIFKSSGESDFISIDATDEKFLKQSGFFKLLRTVEPEEKAGVKSFQLTPSRRSNLYHATHIAYNLFLDDGGLYKKRSYEELLWLLTPVELDGENKNFEFTHISDLVEDNIVELSKQRNELKAKGAEIIAQVDEAIAAAISYQGQELLNAINETDAALANLKAEAKKIRRKHGNS